MSWPLRTSDVSAASDAAPRRAVNAQVPHAFTGRPWAFVVPLAAILLLTGYRPPAKTKGGRDRRSRSLATGERRLR